MTHLVTIEAPDSTVEFVGPRGEVWTREEAVPFTGTLDEAEDEFERRQKRWSARGDCFVRSPKIETAP